MNVYEAAVVYGAMVDALDNDVVIKINWSMLTGLAAYMDEQGIDDTEYRTSGRKVIEVWRE